LLQAFEFVVDAPQQQVGISAQADARVGHNNRAAFLKLFDDRDEFFASALLLLGGQMTPGRIELVEGKGDELARSALFVVRLGILLSAAGGRMSDDS
jgi:hypothetical protein